MDTVAKDLPSGGNRQAPHAAAAEEIFPPVRTLGLWRDNGADHGVIPAIPRSALVSQAS
jgi:hypothetical protein